MSPGMIPVPYQVFYILIPTISIIGNSLIIYVTIRSTRLRSVCNIFIGLISAGDIWHMFAHYIMIISHNLSDDHQLRHDICTELQLFPLFGLFFSSMLLLNVALDRLLSLQAFYIRLIDNYKIAYMSIQIGSALIFALIMDIWIFIDRNMKQRLVCAITAPIQGVVYDAFSVSIMSINVLIIVCYAVFLVLLRHSRINQDTMKNIYRSLIIISLTTIFGWFSTMLIVSVAQVLHVQIDRVYVNLLAGLFVNFACALNFFVYYGVSSEYRQVFNRYLHINSVKKSLGIRVNPTDMAISIIREPTTNNVKK